MIDLRWCRGEIDIHYTAEWNELILILTSLTLTSTNIKVADTVRILTELILCPDNHFMAAFAFAIAGDVLSAEQNLQGTRNFPGRDSQVSGLRSVYPKIMGLRPLPLGSSVI